MSQTKQDRYEDAVLGIILRNPEAATKHEIDERYFQKWHNVVLACKEISAKGDELDILQISSHMNRRDLMVSLNAVRQESSGALANLQKYLDGLRDIWRGEQMRMALSSSIAELNNGGDVDVIISQLMQSTLKAASSETKSHNHNIKQALGIFLDKLETVMESKDSGGMGLQTGIVDLDRVLGGLHPSDMVVVGARPGVGKTSFGASVMMAMAKQGKRVAMISSEMSVDQVMLRVTSLETGIPAHKLRDADLDDNDWPIITAMTNRLLNMGIRIYDKPVVNVADVMLQSKAWMIDGGVDFIVIDYLTRIKPIKSSGNQVLDVGDVVTGMKNVARSLNIPVMVLAQLNRDAANRRPVMSDLRDSGIIEQEADQILMLFRDGENPLNPSEIIVEKNRHGESKIIVPCYFDKPTMRWADLARQHGDDQ
jgi:replicative DNA helicase